MKAAVARTTFTTSRLLEYFSEPELSMQLGQPRDGWLIALLKELVDNSLDACESAGIPPDIAVAVAPDAMRIRDNGCGIPTTTLARALDYTSRTSDKLRYISPTRGQLGNAYKCLFAVPYLLDGLVGHVEVAARGQRHHIEVCLDRLAQEPRIDLQVESDHVKTGTEVIVRVPGLASFLQSGLVGCPDTASELVGAFALFNPHAHFTLTLDGQTITHGPVRHDWRKWTPSHPTSPHWYTPEQFAGLLEAFVVADRETGRSRTIREVVAEFAGFSGSAKQKVATDSVGLTGERLASLVRGDQVDPRVAHRLLAALQLHSRPVPPEALGVLGADVCTGWLQTTCRTGRVRYARKLGTTAVGQPFVVEAAFGESGIEAGQVCVGLNCSPLLDPRTFQLVGDLLASYRVTHDPTASFVLHVATPKVTFTDRAKSALEAAPEIEAAVTQLADRLLTPWKREKQRQDRDASRRRRHLDTLQAPTRPVTVRDAAFKVMAEAYMKASAQNTLPANARQIMYVARPPIQEATGKPLNDQYFCQVVLPDFIASHPEETADWDVVYDARGHFAEPHGGRQLGLGTLEVRKYLEDWTPAPQIELPKAASDVVVRTVGPGCRYRFVLFLEKEGFGPLLERADIARRHDLAIMSTKGMSVTAARQLVEKVSAEGVTVLVLHDFDKSGFSILHTLRTDTRRHTFTTPPRVVDLGLRLADIEALGLTRETVTYKDKVDPRENLAASGATAEECDFLVRDQRDGQWHGARVELNAMTSDQLLEWLEAKLAEAGVTKMVPDDEVLAEAYRAHREAIARQKVIDTALATFEPAPVKVPARLRKQVRNMLAEDPTMPWDAAIAAIARRGGEA